MLRSLLAAVAAGLALVHGTPHADRISAVNGARDTIRCGAGRDVVVAEGVDVVAADCETVSRRISVDRTLGAGQHRTEVEPAAAASGSTVVATFQVGRFTDGGAEAIGYAVSADAGRTWRDGLLPGLTSASGGPWARGSDPTVAYDSLHAVWLIGVLALAADRNGITISRSADGRSWSQPITADAAPGTLAYDKEWLTCDNWSSSPQRGSCYLAWSDEANGGLAVQVSRDGGLTWTAPTAAAPRGSAEVVGAQPAVLPDGSLSIIYVRGNSTIDVVRSADGGASFGSEATLAQIQFAATRLRAPALPSVAVDGAGRIYAVWPDCRFRPGCTGDDVVVASSTDGVVWSEPVRAAAAPSGVNAVVPALGAGAGGRLAVTYYVESGAGIGVAFAASTDGAATWTAPRRLDAAPMQPAWLAGASLGNETMPFLGDYIATAFAGDRPVPVFSLATTAKRQAIFAGAVLRPLR